MIFAVPHASLIVFFEMHLPSIVNLFKTIWVSGTAETTQIEVIQRQQIGFKY